VSTSEVDTWRTVSFWTENLTEVLIWSFLKIELPSIMRIETQGLKNKVVKTQGPKRCLTLIFNQNYDLHSKQILHLIIPLWPSVQHYRLLRLSFISSSHVTLVSQLHLLPHICFKFIVTFTSTLSAQLPSPSRLIVLISEAPLMSATITSMALSHNYQLIMNYWIRQWQTWKIEH